MPRKTEYEGLALRVAYCSLSSLTNESHPMFNQEIFHAVKCTALTASKRPENQGKSQEEIWDATLAYFALGFAGGVYVGIYDGHEDTNLGNDAQILQKALNVYNRVMFGKPEPQWFAEKRHLLDSGEVSFSEEYLQRTPPTIV